MHSIVARVNIIPSNRASDSNQLKTMGMQLQHDFIEPPYLLRTWPCLLEPGVSHRLCIIFIPQTDLSSSNLIPLT